MASRSSRREEPDEESDVIVHYFQILDTSYRQKRETWTVFLGAEIHADYNTLEEATTFARQLAQRHGRRAWLNDATGYPLKPIDLGDLGGQVELAPV